MSGCGLPRSPQSCRGHDGPTHFGWNATYPAERVAIDGAYRTFTCGSEEGFWSRQNFCGVCSVTIFYEIERRPGMISIPAGAFADPDFPPPTVQVCDERACSWLPALGMPRE